MSLTYVGKITLGKRKYLMDIYMLYAMVIRGIKIRNIYVCLEENIATKFKLQWFAH